MTIHATQVGETGERVVFLHGLFGQGKNFTQVAKALQPELMSLLVDLPNHGRSSWTDHVDYADMADTVADFLRADFAADGPVHLVGHSMGGKVAMVLALRHPELIDRRSEADAALQEKIPSPTIRGFLLQNLRAGADDRYSWQANLDVLRRDLATIGDFPDVDATFDHPVLWIAGETSPYVQEEHEERMRQLFPRTRLVTIKGAGHWVHSEQPASFVSALRVFLTA